jgi:hypothetical protein
MPRQHYKCGDHLTQAKIASQPLDASQCLIKSPPLDQVPNERILGLGMHEEKGLGLQVT